MSSLPSGTLTFLFTDIEGSTRLWSEQPRAMSEALARHDAILARAIADSGGTVFKTVGDAFHAAFGSAGDALAAALNLQRDLQAALGAGPLPLRVRCALDSGEALQRDNDYFGPVLNRCARLLGTAHGGQTVLSQATRGLLPASLPEGLGLLDLGEHRLRDFEDAQTVFQLLHPALPSDFPPLASEDRRRHNLPREPDGFVGRQAVLEVVTGLIERAPIVTLTGPGGTGKTRLALRVGAGLLDRFRDGVWLVTLAPLAEPDQVVEGLAAALGLREAPARTLRDTVMDYLRGRACLILLDNCEHLVEACARLAADLLRHCPDLKLLATSREALQIAGEQVYPLPPLATGSAAEGAGGGGIPADPAASDPSASDPNATAPPPSEAALLFAARAAELAPGFALTPANLAAVEQICRAVDGLALAIELAAARSRVLAPDQIAARLGDHLRLLQSGRRDGEPRQQTMRAAIDWSYRLLDEAEQLVLGRLSVFSGGCTLEAAEAVCAGGAIEDFEVLDRLDQLMSKSLLRAAPDANAPRFQLYETIRQYAAEQLAASGEAERLREAQLGWCAGFAAAAQAELQGPEQAEWLGRLALEHDNFRAALAWALDRGSVEQGLGLAADLWRFWYLRGFLGEGHRWLSRLLEAEGATEAAPELRGAATKALGALAYYQGDYDLAQSAWEESISIHRGMGDRAGEARLLNNLGNLLRSRGDHRGAQDSLNACLSLMRAQGDRDGEAGALSNLALVAYERGRLDEAQGLVEQWLEIERATGEGFQVAEAMCLSAGIAMSKADYALAEARGQESLRIYRALGADYGIAEGLGVLTRVACEQGAFARAQRLGEDCLALRRSLGDAQGEAEALICLGLVHLRAGELGAAEARARAGSVLARQVGYMPILAEALMNESQVALARQNPEGAAGLLREAFQIGRDQGSAWIVVRALECLVTLAHADPEAVLTFASSADSLRGTMEAVRPPAVAREIDAALASARAALGPERSARAARGAHGADVDAVLDAALAWLAEAR